MDASGDFSNCTASDSSDGGSSFTIDDDCSADSSEDQEIASSTDGENSRETRYECSVCAKKLRKPSLLKQHLRCHSKERPFCCPIGACISNYKSEDHLKRHLRNKHNGENLSCSWPGCIYITQDVCSFERHKKLHDKKGSLQRCRDKTLEESKKHVCKEDNCGKAFRYPSQLRYHQETHHGEACYSLKELQHRISKELRSDEVDSEYDQSSIGVGDYPKKSGQEVRANNPDQYWDGRPLKKSWVFQCLCSQYVSFPVSSTLTLSFSFAGEIYVDVICSEPGCNERFDHPSDLAEHTRHAHKYVFCEVCGKICMREKIKRHYQTHKKEEVNRERIKCPYPACSLSYLQENNLRKHIKVVHLKRRPYPCSNEDCGKSFAYRHVRDNHERSVHIPGDFVAEDLKTSKKNRKENAKKRKTIEKIEDIFLKPEKKQPRPRPRPQGAQS